MPGFKKLPNAKPIVNITIDETLLKRIEDYQFDNRLPNRSRAFSILVEEGLRHIVPKVVEQKTDKDQIKELLIELIKKL